MTKDSMKLLIVTQKVNKNDDVLGFFHDWIREFARHCEKVIVVCLEKGEYDLPDNVRVCSLGKEENNFQFSIFNFKIFKQIRYLFRFYRLIWEYRKDYDRVFAHMIPMYAIIGAPVWKMLGKKIGLWYAHGYVSFALRIAERLVDTIFTSTKEGCRIKSSKIEIIGQGIDIVKFSISNSQFSNKKENIFNIIAIGRIAPIKDYETLIKAVDILVNEKNRKNIRAQIIGGTLLAEHKSYSAKLEQLVKDNGLENYIEFTGSVPYLEILPYIQSADLFVSTSRTGSLDKVMLEAMSCGVGVVACSEAVRDVLGDYQDRLMYREGNHQELSQKIEQIIKMNNEQREKMGRDLRAAVIIKHSLENLILRIKKCAE